MIKEVGRVDVKGMLVRKVRPAVVEALPPEQFNAVHLPGAVNIPPDRVDELAPALLPDKQQEVVVYCASETCHASDDVARRLVALGYGNVDRYAGGKAEWLASGLPTERG